MYLLKRGAVCTYRASEAALLFSLNCTFKQTKVAAAIIDFVLDIYFSKKKSIIF